MRTTPWKIILSALTCAAILNNAAGAFAQPKKKAKTPVAPKPIEVVLYLENPSGVAIQKKTGHVFIASRYGVYRFVPKTESVHLEIESQSINAPDVYGKGTPETHTKFDIGPLGLAFMDDVHLVVGDGSRKDGAERVRIYKVPDAINKGDDGIKEKDATFNLGPIKASDQSAKGEGNFYGVAIVGGEIFVTCNGDDTKGWIAKAVVKDVLAKSDKLTLTIATKTATGVDAPAPITVTPDGKQLVVGQMGEMNVPGDSLLTFYDPKTGKLLKKYETGMSDIVGIAYSPKTKKLYATDFGWADAANKKKAAKDKKPFKQIGGLYELTIKGDKVEKKLIVNFDKPAGIAFAENGDLYIATFGSGTAADKKAEKSPGKLYLIESGL